MQKQRKSDFRDQSHADANLIIAQVLLKLSLTDSLPEPGFNCFTRLVCLIADVRLSLVTFIDESANRQYFKAAVGLPEGLRQTSLDRSFCKIVARTGHMLAVSDARTDERVMGNPIIEEMGVIAYLGAPISGPSGESFGSLCAVDRVPRLWTESQKRSMSDLAGCVSDRIALRDAQLV